MDFFLVQFPRSCHPHDTNTTGLKWCVPVTPVSSSWCLFTDWLTGSRLDARPQRNFDNFPLQTFVEGASLIWFGFFAILGCLLLLYSSVIHTNAPFFDLHSAATKNQEMGMGLSRACGALRHVFARGQKPSICGFKVQTKWNDSILVSLEPFKRMLERCFTVLSINRESVIMPPSAVRLAVTWNKRNRWKNTRRWQENTF